MWVWALMFLNMAMAGYHPKSIERTHFDFEKHKIVLETFEEDHLFGIQVFIDGEKAYHVHSIPEHLLRHAVGKVRSRIAGIVAEFEETGVLGDYGAIDG